MYLYSEGANGGDVALPRLPIKITIDVFNNNGNVIVLAHGRNKSNSQKYGNDKQWMSGRTLCIRTLLSMGFPGGPAEILIEIGNRHVRFRCGF